ncbi:hypothetical protein J2X90_006020 [Variovorax paradoxus]|uniref:putative Ig domain-containing protein n=1 Tax=Variovorax paradoxus TaxID=34073 RepID=UPI00278523FA|nr:putative Ig domain-containing protein [Variovorax paradoxus]MDQ0028167.1 hypothetical protein [Variovorax paradoxus]
MILPPTSPAAAQVPNDSATSDPKSPETTIPAAPQGLHYAGASVIYLVGANVEPNVPSYSGGSIEHYAIEPALPAGLEIDPVRGVITGTPNALSLPTLYTVTGSNGAGSAKARVQIEVKTQLAAPESLRYSEVSVIYPVGQAVVSLVPTTSGGPIARFSVSPALPAGLSLDSVSGLLSGTPTAVTAGALYTITGSNSAGSAAAYLTLEVRAVTAPPTGLRYPGDPNPVYVAGRPIVSKVPVSSGGAITQYSVTPALPPGLSLNAVSGTISGTPSAVVASAARYTVTGSNTAGSVAAQLSIEVRATPIAPIGLAYIESSAVYFAGQPITPNTPITSGGEITQYRVTPTLPAGLSLNELSGVISGTPNAVVSAAPYTVTGINASGSVSARLSIEVRAAPTAPTGLRYSDATALYVVGEPIVPNRPITLGGEITQYTVTPALPAGLSLDASSGTISGTPSAAIGSAIFRVIGSNSAGSVEAQLVILVRAVAPPTALAYSDPAPVYIVGRPIVPNIPVFRGGAPTNYVTAELPAGLSLDPVSGVISGTPVKALNATVYSVFGSNESGSIRTTVWIAVMPASDPGAPLAPTSIKLQSDPGDFIGQGKNYEYSRTNASLGLSVNGSKLHLEIEGDQWWSADFVLPDAMSKVEIGTYSNLARYPFHLPTAGGMAWDGDGRGCNVLLGSFTIHSATYSNDVLTALDLSFEQNCEGVGPALHGQIHWSAYDVSKPPGPVNPPPAGLWMPAAGETPSTGSYIYLISDLGDYVGGGASYLYTSPTSAAAIKIVGRLLSVNVGNWWGFFNTMTSVDRLEPGYYGDLNAYPFHNLAKGGLTWYGNGRGCSKLTGWFAVDEVTYLGGELKSIDLRFEQHCEGNTPALRGKVHWVF